ncbi:MAG: hypothetical protein IJ351_04270 [Oscillospiraceae bacterium]|nr:hypothetical protein [Oscillospiraceae bacterium]
MEQYYEIAGLRLKLTCPDALLSEGDGVLKLFRTQPGQWEHHVTFSVVDTLPQPEGEPVHTEAARWIYRRGETQIRYEGALQRSLEGAYLRLERTGRETLAQVKKSAIPYGITSKLLLIALEAEHLIAASGGIMLHAAWIEYKGKAIVFTAPSGTGKSTQAQLWQEHRGAFQRNGDRAAIYPMKETVEVRGIPFCGSSGITYNTTVPLAAVVYLSQSPTTVITPLRGVAAFRALWEGCSVNVWNDGDLAQCTQTLTEIVTRVPVFHLACTPDETAVIALEKEGIL